MVSSVFIIDWSIQDPEGAKRQQEQMAQVDQKAKENGLTVLKEFGMDPGLDLIVAGETVRQLDKVKVLYTYGAGFPEHKLSQANPIGYKFTWSIIDTICSYRIPGRIVKNGKIQEIPADGMFVPGNYHLLDLKEMGGPLECFVNGDGESLARLFPAIAKSATTLGRFICRWPGHAAFWEKMVKSGFNRIEPVKVNGVDVIPAAFCAALLGSQQQFRSQPDHRLSRSENRLHRHAAYRGLPHVYRRPDDHGRASLETGHRRTLGSSLQAIRCGTLPAGTGYHAEGRTLGRQYRSGTSIELDAGDRKWVIVGLAPLESSFLGECQICLGHLRRLECRSI
jgi:hypothetical protein